MKIKLKLVKGKYEVTVDGRLYTFATSKAASEFVFNLHKTV